MQTIIREDLDIAKATIGVEKELIRLKGKLIYQMYKENGRQLSTRFINNDHKKLCTIRRMHILSRYNMKLGTMDIDNIGGDERDIRNILVLEKELEPTQTCLAPVDLHPVQVLAQMGITELAQVAKSGYMFSMEDLSRIFGEKFGNVQKGAYNQMCKTLCKGGEQDGPKTRKMNPKNTYWNNKCNRELHDRFKHLTLSGEEKGTIRKCWDTWNNKRCTAEIDATTPNTEACNTAASTSKCNKRAKKVLPHETTEKAVSTFCLGDVLTEVPVHPTGETKHMVNISREGKNFQIPVVSIPMDLLLRSYGEEWKRAFEHQEASSVHGVPVKIETKKNVMERKRPREHERVHIDTQENNPAEDITWDQKDGPCILIEGQLAKCFSSKGKFVSSLATSKLEDLWHRFNWASKVGLHNELDPPIASFEWEVIMLLSRYPMKIKKNRGGGKDLSNINNMKNHWTLPQSFMSNVVHNGLNTYVEMFASPLDVHIDTHTYYSKYDRDKVFGAKGNAYDVKWEGKYEFNPEYVPIELEKALLWAVHSAKDSKVPTFGIGIFPAWKYTAERKHIERLVNENSGICKLITIPEAQFDLLTPDHWTGKQSKYSEGNQTSWDIEVIVVANKAGWEEYEHETFKTGIERATFTEQKQAKPPIPFDMWLRTPDFMERVQFNHTPWKNEGTTKETWIGQINLSETDLQIPKEYTRLLMDIKKQEKNVAIRCMPHTVHSLPKVDTPVSWRSQKPRLQHADRLGIYTDGSCMNVTNDEDETEARTGIGVFSQRTNERLSFRTKIPMSILHAELAGILHAVEMDAQPGETSRHIYTDNLVSLHLLNKTRMLPSIMARHKHGRTLRMILLKAGAKLQHGSSTEYMSIHLYKVRAHSGIEGNEIADELAKRACLEPMKAQIIELLEDNSKTRVIRDAEGNEMDYERATQQISRIELADAEREDEYLRNWNAIGEDDKPKLDKERSLGYARRAKRRQYAGDEQTFRTLVRIKQCKAKTLLTGKLRYTYGLQQTPYCTLCQHEGRDNVVSDVTHILGGCPSEALRKLHCIRHDQTVDRVFDSIVRGNKGAVTVLHDTGKYQDMDANRKHTLPQYLHSRRIVDKRAVRRPDIVLIFRVRGDRQLPEAFVPLGKGDDKRILILEISYTALGLMNARVEDKRRKYEDTLNGLRNDGWEPELYILVLGTLGEIPSNAVQILEELGVRGPELDRLIEDIHMIAVNKADECIQREILRHEEISGIRPSKSRVVRQHLKRPNNEKTREKCKTNNKRKAAKVTNEKKSKLLFRIHNEDSKRKGEDQLVEKTARKRPKNLDGVDVHTPASKRRSKVRKKSCRK